MASTFSTHGLASASARHPWRVILLWVLAIVAAFVLTGQLLSSAVTNEASATSNPDSLKAEKLLVDRLRGPFRVNEAVIVQSPSLTVDDPAYRSYVEALQKSIVALGEDKPKVQSAVTYYQTNLAGLVSQDRHTTLIPVTMSGDIDQAAKNIKDVLKVVDDANHQETFKVYVAGQASVGHDFNTALEEDLSRSEFITIPMALIILLIVFGALAAALLPVFFSVVAIFLAIGATAVIGQQFQFAFFVTNMIFMMGLAVGIDYCLFVVSRFREERAHGVEKESAIEIAAATAGRAVLFSGLTVVVALLGLLLVPQTIFRSLGGGAILVVLASVLASLTLLPALLQLVGDGVNSWIFPSLLRRVGVPLPRKEPQPILTGAEAPHGFWDRIARIVMAQPVVSVVLAGGFLVALSLPYWDIKVGFSGLSTLPDSFQSKQGFEIMQREFAGGQVYPAEVVIDGNVNSPEIKAAVQRLQTAVTTDQVFGPSQFQANQAGDLGLLSIQLAADPNALEATDGIERLRQDYIGTAFQGVDAKVYVGGLAAQNLDGYKITTQYLPIVIGFVLALSFLLLMMVFRSIVVPIKAIILNLLSVGAAYGLLVLVFQKGVGNELLGFTQVEAIEAWLPLFLFSILFGLSMDYHVFLLSRIRERYDQTGDNTEAVAFGLRSTGRLITGAALIMVAVFGGFALGDLVMFQQMGFGLGVAVLIDATVIRCMLVPASMKLLGKWNWYLPSALGWLPHLGVGEEMPASTSAHGSRPSPEGI